MYLCAIFPAELSHDSNGSLQTKYDSSVSGPDIFRRDLRQVLRSDAATYLICSSIDVDANVERAPVALTGLQDVINATASVIYSTNVTCESPATGELDQDLTVQPVHRVHIITFALHCPD